MANEIFNRGKKTHFKWKIYLQTWYELYFIHVVSWTILYSIYTLAAHRDIHKQLFFGTYCSAQLTTFQSDCYWFISKVVIATSILLKWIGKRFGFTLLTNRRKRNTFFIRIKKWLDRRVHAAQSEWVLLCWRNCFFLIKRLKVFSVGIWTDRWTHNFMWIHLMWLRWPL